MADFYQSSTAEIDAKLALDTLRHKEKRDKNTIIAILVVLFLFRGFFSYWIKFGKPVAAKAPAQEISVNNDPIQINYSNEEQNKKRFVYTSLLNKHKITIIPQAHYELSGLVVALNHNFWFKDDFFDSAALYDLGVAWGAIGKKEIYSKYFKSYSAKTEATGSRVLWTESKIPNSFTRGYVNSHFSHSHIVPANKNIMAALLKLKKWDIVKIDGELIDMEYMSRGIPQSYQTSMTRTDIGMDGDRGNGSCETIYVTKVQIGNKIYR